MKEKNVIDFYILCNRLKDVVRTGWKTWNVNRFRVESVAEHIYGVQMLAIAMWSEFRYDVDISKVLAMIAVHEVEEIVIGDLTQWQISKNEKRIVGKEAVRQVFSKLSYANKFEDLIDEFNEKQTKESKFAYFCDKLEGDLQSKIYDEEGCVNLIDQGDNVATQDKVVKEMLDKGFSFSKMWQTYGLEKYGYDKNFENVSKIAMQTDILCKPKGRGR